MKKLEPLYTVSETAKILNVSEKTVRRLIEDGLLRACLKNPHPSPTAGFRIRHPPFNPGTRDDPICPTSGHSQRADPAIRSKESGHSAIGRCLPTR